MPVFSALGGFEQEMIGKTIFMMIGLFEDNKLYYFNTGSPNFPKFSEDWKALNYFINLSDLMVLSVL